ncbi:MULTISPECIES: fluoride efflux transporter CrcB [Nonomuraea]|uniref:Fluoride-specific ion channel FluC n=1 Tax=Nonomuraea ferruginea TaxID=46174 RepID=A0ABT4TAM9_9ACTN|nr:MULTISPECIES: fluoride efflux transporter CrcB [Nonomuraea]MDA0646568.1 fluoride efflux transporter CrcB [Nonomuraea ferruginea]TXK41131.1 fluoride efflux transporter CrcB [Nonomuraea sp. C10]
MTALLVVLGAAVGAPLRYAVDQAVRARQGSMFPWGTLLVNVAGSALLGFLAALPVGPGWTALLGTGFCGALTTYSTLGYETVRLAERGAGRHAVANAVASVALGLAAAAGGVLLARTLG